MTPSATMSRRFGTALALGTSVAFAASLLATGPATAASAAPAAPEGRVLGASAPGAIKDRYIVVMKDSVAAASGVRATARDLAGRFGGEVAAEYTSAVRGFTARMSETAAKRLAADPAVASVEQDRTVTIAGSQTNPTWGLDRVDQRALPLSGSYTYPGTAANVTAYVLDTGVRLTHAQFGGRARSGYDFIDNDSNASDCQGHGTHVAGTVAGSTYGVAKAAQVVSVRVLDCNGSGSYSAIIGGVDWVTKNAVKPAVANLSLGGSASSTLDNAVRNSIASGVTYVLAAGNDNVDACNQSPARTAEAITVGATDSADKRASFSNYGTCLDIFAPGVNVLSAAKGGDTATATMSGTSMAAPHVAGVAALYLAANPAATPEQVRSAMVTDSTTGKVLSPGTGSANRLVYTGAIPAPGSTTPTTPTVPVACTFTNGFDLNVTDGATITSKLTVSGCGGTASATSTVEVHVKHADRGDLTVSLVAPDGTSYRLKSAVSGDNYANLDATYTVNLSTETRDGLWNLKVTDSYTGDTGLLDSWTMTL